MESLRDLGGIVKGIRLSHQRRWKWLWIKDPELNYARDLCVQSHPKSLVAQTEICQLKQVQQQLVEENRHDRFYSERYEYIVNRFLLPYAGKRRVQFDDRTTTSLDFLLVPLIQHAQESAVLQNQVRSLQQELLSKESNVITNALSDDYFAEEFRRLAAQIKTLSRVLHPHENKDMFKVLGPCVLGATSQDQWASRIGRKLFIEAWMWSRLIYLIFRTPFVVHGPGNDAAFNLWSSLFGMQHIDSWPQPSIPCETWRYMTNGQLVATLDTTDPSEARQKGQDLNLEQHAIHTWNTAKEYLEAPLAAITPTDHSAHVSGIVNGAFRLATNMSLQRSRLQITYPEIGDKVNMAHMTPLPSCVEENMDNGIVTLVINPGLTKWGNAHGKFFDHRLDIVPALVTVNGRSA
ncbi:hypothetical protein PMIN04_012662 [Paraphaeosphaeria minitans]